MTTIKKPYQNDELINYEFDEFTSAVDFDLSKRGVTSFTSPSVVSSSGRSTPSSINLEIKNQLLYKNENSSVISHITSVFNPVDRFEAWESELSAPSLIYACDQPDLHGSYHIFTKIGVNFETPAVLYRKLHQLLKKDVMNGHLHCEFDKNLFRWNVCYAKSCDGFLASVSVVYDHGKGPNYDIDDAQHVIECLRISGDAQEFASFYHELVLLFESNDNDDIMVNNDDSIELMNEFEKSPLAINGNVNDDYADKIFVSSVDSINDNNNQIALKFEANHLKNMISIILNESSSNNNNNNIKDCCSRDTAILEVCRAICQDDRVKLTGDDVLKAIKGFIMELAKPTSIDNVRRATKAMVKLTEDVISAGNVLSCDVAITPFLLELAELGPQRIETIEAARDALMILLNLTKRDAPSLIKQTGVARLTAFFSRNIMDPVLDMWCQRLKGLLIEKGHITFP